MPKFTAETAAAHGRKGGHATHHRHGRDHMRAIGRRGYERTRDRHFAGDDQAMGRWLHRRGVSATDGRMRESAPWLRPIAADPGSPAEYMAAREPGAVAEARAAYAYTPAPGPGGSRRPPPLALAFCLLPFAFCLLSRRLSHAERARRKVARLAARLPLFAQAGILDQVADVAYDARRVADEDFARALASDEARVIREREHALLLAAHRQLLADALGTEAATRADAAYLDRWRDHWPMRSAPYHIDHLCRLVADSQGATPLAVYAEARRRAGLAQ